MVALFVIALLLCALTADYFVQCLARRAPALHAAARTIEGIFMDASHLWIQPEPSGLARIGADSMVGVLLGWPEHVDWPSMGPVKRGAALATVHYQGRRLTLRSPVDGDVVEQNTRLGTISGSASAEAWDAGWLVRLRPVDLVPHLAAMRTGERLREWSRMEMDRLRAFVLSHLPVGSVGATAADGGTLGAEVVSQLDDAVWNEAVRLMLGADAQEQDAESDWPLASVGGRA